MARIVPWIDPYSRERLEEKDGFLVGKNSKYEINNGIPNFVLDIEPTSENSPNTVPSSYYSGGNIQPKFTNELTGKVSKIFDAKNSDQHQVKESFGYKWTRTNFGQTEDDFNKKARKMGLEFLGLSENDLKIFDDKIILDTGVGSGSTARLWALRAKEFHGIDISKAVYRVKNALNQMVSKPILAQADLNFLPYDDNVFDVIVSAGVFHHTPNTKLAIKNVIRTLKREGLLIFYIYKKKAPIREFSDDFIRSFVSNMPFEKAWEEMKSFTDFGKSLKDQAVKIKVPSDIPILKIKSGEYDLQDFIYNHFFKCFWNKDFGYDDSVMTNFDWYHPKFSWRQTKEEIQEWCDEIKLKIKYLKEGYSSYACMVSKL